jgi:hypothetical protein
MTPQKRDSDVWIVANDEVERPVEEDVEEDVLSLSLSLSLSPFPYVCFLVNYAFRLRA